jgi:hypothetical protein
MRRRCLGKTVLRLALFVALPLTVAQTAASASSESRPAWFPREACASRPDSASLRYDVNRGGSYADYAAKARRRDCYKPWTILVYMAADNDLAPYAYWDLYEMEAGYRSGREAAGSSARSDLLVQLSAPGSTDSRRIHMFQSPEPYRSDLKLEDFRQRGASGVRSPVASVVPRTEGGKPVAAAADLDRFLEWGIREYPAEHYMVVIWGHGQGWAPAAVPDGGSQLIASQRDLKGLKAAREMFGELPKSEAKAAPLATEDFSSRHFGGLAFSSSQGTFLDIPSLHKSLRKAEEKLLDGRPIDVYASDACLMQMVEVATEISDSARFIAGSSQVENYLGLPYRRMMFEINTGRFSGERSRPGVAGSRLAHDEPYLLARMLPRLFRMSLEEHGLHGRILPEAIQTVTMSSLASDELRQALIPSLGDFAAAMKHYLDEQPMRAIDVQETLRDSPSFMGGSQELGGFMTLVRAMLKREREDSGTETAGSRELALATDRVHDALNRTVVSYALGKRYTASEEQLHLLGFRAVALWLPVSPGDFNARIRDFSSSLFYRKLGGTWEQWLSKVFRD